MIDYPKKNLQMRLMVSDIESPETKVRVSTQRGGPLSMIYVGLHRSGPGPNILRFMLITWFTFISTESSRNFSGSIYKLRGELGHERARTMMQWKLWVLCGIVVCRRWSKYHKITSFLNPPNQAKMKINCIVELK